MNRGLRLTALSTLLSLSLALDSATAAPSPDGSGCGTLVTSPVVSGSWDLASSPYCVQNTITAVNLTIEAGVCVQMAPGAYIDAAGRLSILGTASQPVVVTERDAGLGWSGIRFVSSMGAGSVIEHCTIEKSTDRGLHIVASDPIVRDTTIRGCSSPSGGAGMYVSLTGSSLTLDNVWIVDSVAPANGAGILAELNSSSVLELSNCTLENNYSYNPNQNLNRSGAGIQATGNGLLTISGSTFLDNRARGSCNTFNCSIQNRGAAVYCIGVQLEVAHSVFLRNHHSIGASHALGAGGAIYVAGSGSSLDVLNSVFGCNDASIEFPANAEARGGAIYAGVDVTSASIRFCTFARNAPAAVHDESGNATIDNSILFFNFPTGASTWGAQATGNPTIQYSDVQGGWTGLGNFSANPIFEGTGCELGDFQLNAFSPCVDAADPTLSDACLPPGLGRATADCGAHGGPDNCGWGSGQTFNYCDATANSTGAVGQIAHTGSTSVGTNDFVLHATQIPNQPGLFFHGPSQVSIPFGNGIRCVGGQLVRLGPPQQVTGNTVQRSVDLTPIGVGARYFQFWFRDSAAGGAAFDLTNALAASFQP